jgi:uncharacterized protein YukE
MGQAIVDPGELRRFAQSLKTFNNDLQARMSQMHGQLAGLSQTWRDREQVKFTEEFEQTLVVIGRFIEAANQHIPFLLRKAERVEDSLPPRGPDRADTAGEPISWARPHKSSRSTP